MSGGGDPLRLWLTDEFTFHCLDIVKGLCDTLINDLDIPMVEGRFNKQSGLSTLTVKQQVNNYVRFLSAKCSLRQGIALSRAKTYYQNVSATTKNILSGSLFGELISKLILNATELFDQHIPSSVKDIRLMNIESLWDYQEVILICEEFGTIMANATIKMLPKNVDATDSTYISEANEEILLLTHAELLVTHGVYDAHNKHGGEGPARFRAWLQGLIDAEKRA